MSHFNYTQGKIFSPLHLKIYIVLNFRPFNYANDSSNQRIFIFQHIKELITLRLNKSLLSQR